MEIRGDGAAMTVYEAVGGTAFFVELVDRFYDGVETDPVLRPMYPADLVGAKARLAGFLVQYWGGPATYSEQRGHPRLRMRHAPYVIDGAAHDAWLRHMRAAVAAVDPGPEITGALLEYFVMAARHMINAADGPATPG